jgi:predicted nicotinamide N-methyase
MMNVRDPTLLRLPPSEIQCGEVWKERGRGTPPEDADNGDDEDDEVGSVLFWLQVSPLQRRLKFSCRKGSVGVLEEHEILPPTSAREALEEAAYEQADPQFFDPGYTLAGATGFQIWAGTRLLIETLVVPKASDCAQLQAIQRHLLSNNQNHHSGQPHQPKRILELGAGIGVVGITLAAAVAGAHVILTDLPALVEHATQWNVHTNRSRAPPTASEAPAPSPPAWCTSESVLIGNDDGWATTMALDWRIPIHQQLPLPMYDNLDYIVASDCVWLVSMLDALLDTVAAIFEASEGDESPTFTTVNRVIQTIGARGWTVECLAWRPIRVIPTTATNTTTTMEAADGTDSAEPDEKEVFVFAIRAKLEQ